MRISINDLKRAGALHMEFDELPQGTLREHENLKSAHTVTDIVLEGDEVRVVGTVDARIQGACARCVKDVEYGVKAEFDEVFSENPEEGYALGASDVVLDDMVMDAISMEMPIRVLCSEDCKGLCPKCGADLNEGDCGCENGPDETSPFYKLKGMFE